MIPYNCQCCVFTTKIKTHFIRHLKTKKHLLNEQTGGIIIRKSIKMNQNEPQMNQNGQNTVLNEPAMNQNEPKTEKNEHKKTHQCDYCDCLFNTIPSKRRHELHRCKFVKKEKMETDKIKIMIQEQKKEKESYEKEKSQLYKYIETLIEKQGTTINIDNPTTNNNSININSYGNEDLSHITDAFKTELLKGPYGMIQKMIEAVHFNKEKPENNNIIMPNKNEKMLKILDGDKWIYKDKDETINDLIDWKNFMLDNHYEHLYNIKELTHFLNSRHISTYKRFQKLFDTEGVDLHEQLRKECKLLLLNNR
jgi:hypothetical protein